MWYDEQMEGDMAASTTAAQTVTSEWVEEFVDQWIAAWNSHQPERVLELMTDDIVYDDSGSPQTMRGQAQVREFLDFIWRAFPAFTTSCSASSVSSIGVAWSRRWIW